MTRILTPDDGHPRSFTDATEAVDYLQELYTTATTFLRAQFLSAMTEGAPDARVRAFYPEVRVTTLSYAQIDTRLSFGHVPTPGTYATTITRPDLFRNYLIQQIDS